ncbi:MAG: bifunctional hydroxymethylpyrimidine kinase/phosphomethylpyrimidine kinase [Desulfatiglandales bacterium]
MEKGGLRPKVLTIAASDPTSGAGIQADIRTIALLRAHPLCCVTAITIQSTTQVKGVYPLPVDLIRSQVEAVLSDGTPQAVKIGMLYDEGIVELVSQLIEEYGLRNVVLDPLFLSSTGQLLTTRGAYKLLAKRLLPAVQVITPNGYESIALLRELDPQGFGKMDSPESLSKKLIAERLKDYGPHVLITGGDLDGRDLLLDERGFYEIAFDPIGTKNTHGTGCVFSSALATYLAFGFDLRKAFRYAKIFVVSRISLGYPIGKGHGVLGLP